MPTVAGLLLAVEIAGAHPHSYLDQQAFISIGRNAVDMTIRIAPSYVDGLAIFASIDADGNGVVSADEAAAFATTVSASARIEVDGRVSAFSHAAATVPDIESVSAGFGIIEVEATASFALGGSGEHQVLFEISYDEFSHHWQVQPYFYEDFSAVTSPPLVTRSEAGNQVGIQFHSQDAK